MQYLFPRPPTIERTNLRHNGLRVVVADELRRLGRTLRKPGFLKDRRHLRVRGEALPARLVPVEDRPDPVALVRIPKDVRSLAAVRLSLLRARSRERVPEAVEVLNLRRRQDHLLLLPVGCALTLRLSSHAERGQSPILRQMKS